MRELTITDWLTDENGENGALYTIKTGMGYTSLYINGEMVAHSGRHGQIEAAGVRVFDRCLSSAEIVQMYEEAISG